MTITAQVRKTSNHITTGTTIARANGNQSSIVAIHHEQLITSAALKRTISRASSIYRVDNLIFMIYSLFFTLLSCKSRVKIQQGKIRKLRHYSHHNNQLYRVLHEYTHEQKYSSYTTQSVR